MEGRKKAQSRKGGREGVGGGEWLVENERNQESYVAPSPHYNPPTHTNRGTP